MVTSFKYHSFFNKRKTTILFPSPLIFLKLLVHDANSIVDVRQLSKWLDEYTVHKRSTYMYSVVTKMQNVKCQRPCRNNLIVKSKRSKVRKPLEGAK